MTITVIIIIFYNIGFCNVFSVTNYFLVNLSIADLLVTFICMPIAVGQSVTGLWLYGETMCKLTSYLQGKKKKIIIKKPHRYVSIFKCRPNATRPTATARRLVTLLFSNVIIRYLLRCIPENSVLRPCAGLATGVLWVFCYRCFWTWPRDRPLSVWHCTSNRHLAQCLCPWRVRC